MSSLPRVVVDFLATGPLAHVVTLSADGAPPPGYVIRIAVAKVSGAGPWNVA